MLKLIPGVPIHKIELEIVLPGDRTVTTVQQPGNNVEEDAERIRDVNIGIFLKMKQHAFCMEEAHATNNIPRITEAIIGMEPVTVLEVI